MPVDRRHDAPHVPAVRYQLVLELSFLERIDDSIPFGMNRRLTAGEAADYVAEELASFVDYPGEEREGDCAHFGNVVANAMRTTKVAVPGERES